MDSLGSEYPLIGFRRVSAVFEEMKSRKVWKVSFRSRSSWLERFSGKGSDIQVTQKAPRGAESPSQSTSERRRPRGSARESEDGEASELAEEKGESEIVALHHIQRTVDPPASLLDAEWTE